MKTKPPKKAEFHTGPEAAKRFKTTLKAALKPVGIKAISS